MARPSKSSPEELEEAAKAIRRMREEGSDPQAWSKARQFRSTWTAEQVEDLLARCVRHRCAIGTSVVACLLAVPERDRIKVLNEILRRRLPLAMVRALVKTRYGPRRSGGRPRRTAQDPAGIMAEVEVQCESLRRYRRALECPAPDGSGRTLAESLPPGVLAALDAVVTRAEVLQEVCEAELKVLVPTRSTRRDTRHRPAAARSR